ncbi:unnamed protein product, partial [Rotaria socialis]
FWGRHNVFFPCDNICSKLINADGNWKFGRHICMDKTKVSSCFIISLMCSILVKNIKHFHCKHKTSYFISQLLDIAFRTTAEFYSVIVRCDKTPKPGVDYCDEHRDRRHVSIMSEDEDCIDNEDFIKLRNGKQYMRYQSLTCNTTKSFPMKYVSACHRSFVIIVYFTNCGVCLSINEIYRGETVKEILMVWFDIISATSTNIKSTLPSEVANTPLPRVILYGDCCHLIKYLIDYYDYTIHKTPASSWLINCQFAIDKLHWPNHKDIWCRKYLCPYKNPVVQANNTQSCEQANSVLKKYVNQFNRMNEERSVLMLYFLMHGRNCILKKLNVFERCVASNKMPMNTRFAANRRSVRQTQTSKCKKLPGFLLQGLTHRNNVNQNEESSSFSDVENISIHNQKRDNSNGIDSRSNDRLAKKTRMNENEIEMHDSDLLVADSSPITYCKDLSHLLQQNDNQEFMLSTYNMDQPPNLSLNDDNAKCHQHSFTSEQQVNCLSTNNQMDHHTEQHQN